MNNIQDLKALFDIISSKEWVRSVSDKHYSSGETFESLVGVETNSFELPDYNGIEIKTRKLFLKSYIKLFNSTPDGKYLFEIKRIRDTYGYPSQKIKDTKVFNISIYTNKIISIGNNYRFELEVNKSDERIYLHVIDKNNKLIDKQTFWSFNTLKEKLSRKLQILTVIDTLEKKENNIRYYKYTNIKFYGLKDFDYFIELIEKGIIRITFKINVFLSGKRMGEIHDHGTGFEIKEEDLYKLYDKINI